MTQPDDLDIEAPEADAAEQAAYADPAEHEDVRQHESIDSHSIEAPEWDVLEQSQVVPVDDDDYT
jgi:hypothetical protein